MLLATLTWWSAYPLELFQEPHCSLWTVWRPDTRQPTCMAMQWECHGSSTHLSRQVMGEQHGIAAREGGGARLGVPRSQAEPRPLKRPILDPFWSDLWCLMSQEKLWRHGVWPALLIKPLLIYLICPGTGLCAATSKKSLWLKEKLTKHTLLYFMPKSARVIFSDQNRNPCKIVGYSENGNSITNGDTNTRGLEFT